MKIFGILVTGNARSMLPGQDPEWRAAASIRLTIQTEFGEN